MPSHTRVESILCATTMVVVLSACGGGGGGGNSASSVSPTPENPSPSPSTPTTPSNPSTPPNNEIQTLSSIWTTNITSGWSYQLFADNDDFSDYATERRDAGFRPWDIEVSSSTIANRYSSIWVRNEGLGWSYQIGYDGDAFNDYVDKMRDQGYRPWDLEISIVNGMMSYSSIWVTNDGIGWAFRINSDLDEFSHEAAELRDAGYRPIDLEVVTSPTSGNITYAGVWVTNFGGGWSYQISYDSDRFSDYVETMKDRGYRPLDLEISEVGGARRYSSIWIQNEGVGWSYQVTDDLDDFSDYADQQKNEGLRPWDIN